MRIDNIEFRDKDGNEITPTKEQMATYIHSLHEQLAEKDKEIEMYNNFFKAFACDNFDEYRDFIGTFMLTPHEEQTLIRELKNNQKSIRKQVCVEWWDKCCQIIEKNEILDIQDIKKIKYEIEKGE